MDPNFHKFIIFPGPPLLRGRLTSRMLPDAAGSGPALLRKTGQVRLPVNMAGLAWLSVDSLCGLYYEVINWWLFCLR